MDVFSLIETEFSRQLTNGENEILLIANKDFVLQTSENSLSMQYKFSSTVYVK